MEKTYVLFFFFNDTATTEIYTLSLHDALPICRRQRHRAMDRLPGVRRHPDFGDPVREHAGVGGVHAAAGDRKSTRLNSSHSQISYAVFCLKKKKNFSLQMSSAA